MILARLDVFLKQTGLIKQRSQAKQACEEERVRVDGTLAKASRSIKPGEIIAIDVPGRHIEAEVIEIPRRQPPKSQRHRYLKILRQETVETDEYLTF